MAIRAKTRKRIAYLLRAAVAVALLYALWTRAEVDSLTDAIADTDMRLLGAALALVPIAIGIRAYNFLLLLNRDDRIMTAFDSLRLTYVGVGASLFLPTGAADLFKAHLGTRFHGRPEDIVATTVIDKITALTAVAAMGATGAVLEGEPFLAAAAAFVMMVSLVPLTWPRIVPWRLLLRFLARGASVSDPVIQKAISPPRRLLLRVISVSVFGWVMTYSVVFLVCASLGIAVSIWYVLSLAPFTALARLIPISAGGVGLGEFTLVALLTRVGVSEVLAVRASLLALTFIVLLPGLVGILTLVLTDWRHREIRVAEAETAETSGLR